MSVVQLMINAASGASGAGFVVEILVVGGGGSGLEHGSGSDFGAGGNGGDVTVGASFALTKGAPLSVEIGSGGAVLTSAAVPGNAGTRSLFGTLEAAGAGSQPRPASVGVSNGSSTVLTSPLITQTTTTTTQYAGQHAGYGQFNTIVGGGAGGYADAYSSSGGHRAGAGYQWGVTNSYYAGGGGSSGIAGNATYWPYLGGQGGGGNGATGYNVAGGNGTVNTGGGGGGGYNVGSGAGGSGVVIVWIPQTGYTAANNKYSQTGLTITETDNSTNAATSAIGTLLTITAHSGSASITFN